MVIVVVNKKWNFGLIVMVVVISFSIFLLGFTMNISNDPVICYTVYLDGKFIGIISSKEDFENFINTKEEELKNKYNVDTVHTPKGVEIKKNITYSPSISTNETIYNKIISNKKFTIQGYQITITSSNNDEDEENNKIIYVLSKDIFDKAVENTIRAFVDNEQYDKFLAGTQEEVKDNGSMIENIDLEEIVTYKETLISTDEKIFTDVDELSKYLLYGTLDEQETYTVQSGDTIESIASEHKLNVQEFLIANPEFTSANNLLYESQKVVVGLIKPLISVVVDMHSVGDRKSVV